MKKLVFAIFLLIGVGSGLFYYQRIYKADNFFPEFFLPENVLVYINQQDFGFIAQDFKNKPLAKTISSIDFVRLALDLELSFETVNTIRKIRDFLGSPRATLFFEEYLNREFSFALLQENDSQTLDEFFQRNLLFFCKPKHGISIQRLFGSLISDNLQMKSTQYGEHVIYKVFLDKETTLSGVMVEKMLILSLEEFLLRAALNRYDENGANLSEDYFFMEQRQDTVGSLFFCLFKIDQLLIQIRHFIGEQSGIAGEFIASLENWEGFTTGAFSAYKEEMYAKNKLRLYFNQYKLNKHTAHFLNIKPEKEPVINSVPENAFFYYWTNTFDLKTMWEIYASESGEEDLVLIEFEKSIEQMAGISFSDILELPGNTINVVLLEASTIDLVPVPNFSLIFNLQDKRKAEKVIQRLLVKNKIPHKKGKYKGVEYTYWGEDIQRGLQPVYAINGTNLYISSSVKMNKDIVNTIKSGRNLVSTDKFKASAQDLLQSNNSCLFVELSELLEVVKKVAIWSGTMIAIQNRKTAHKSKILVNRLIIPLLDGLKMYSTLASRSYTDKGVVTVETTIALQKI